MGVIHLFGEPPAVEGAPTVGDRDYKCHPHRPVVDPESRSVSCARCKRQLDPIDVLYDVARRHEQWQALGDELRTMRAAIAALQREEKRVRARTKSHDRKDANVAVANERQRQARIWVEVQSRTDDIRRHLKRIDQLMGKKT
jgi:hypothetical protein